MQRGSFTLPGEAGYEKLTLDLAKKWGADVIRDSDGTKLSDEIRDAGYGIYSTICIIRQVNSWAKENMDKLQQNFLMSFPVIAEGDTLTIDILKGYFTQQFMVNWNDDPKEFWQVFDRTTGKEVTDWTYDKEAGTVTVNGCVPYHKYTVNFLAIRLWEEISMYNHITNDWGDKEHLMAVEPRHPATQQCLLDWLEKWCQDNPATTVVRFTSMFYNFTWIWSDDMKNRDLFSDWGSYDFTVNPIALRAFKEEKGWAMTSEDFINNGKHNSTHNAPTARYREWMDFVNRFVVEFGKKCIDIVHKYGKKAYVFYDDSWVGVEPYGQRFAQFGFDGIIKCVFNGFEARLGAGVKGVDTHELRLHPYLFPTGLTGEPTFAPGGNPKLDAQRFWIHIRRALLREKVDRIGMGGYLHLVEPFPDFCDYIEAVADEFRTLKDFCEKDKPYTIPGKVAVLHSWGSLRSWICSGHLHEHPEVDLTNVNEALSGLPLDVVFMSFDDVLENGIPEDVKVIINAGCKGSAWSGGDAWKNAELITKITEFVHNGGGLIGVNEPSATEDEFSYFALTHIFGVDRDTGVRKCLRKFRFENEEGFVTGDDPAMMVGIRGLDGVFVDAADVKVLASENGQPTLTCREFGKGRALYLSGYRFSLPACRLILRAVCYAMGKEDAMEQYVTSNIMTECAYYPAIDKLVIINNAETEQTTSVNTARGKITVTLKPFDIIIL